MCTTIGKKNNIPLPKPLHKRLSKPLVVLAPEAVAAEATVAVIIINGILGIFPTEINIIFMVEYSWDCWVKASC